MEYYNHEGMLVEYNHHGKKKTFQGCCGKVYAFDDYIFKKYFYSTEDKYRIHYEIFQILNSLCDRHLMEINELLIKKRKYNLKISVEDNFKNRSIDAYIAQYYKSDNSNILERNINFILEMLNEFETLIETISLEQILLVDIQPKNVIVQENNMVIIDWDQFFKVSYEYEKLINTNLYYIVYLFQWLLRKSCKNYKDKQIVDKLFNFLPRMGNFFEEKSPAKTLSNRLNGYKTINEYICKNR